MGISKLWSPIRHRTLVIRFHLDTPERNRRATERPNGGRFGYPWQGLCS